MYTVCEEKKFEVAEKQQNAIFEKFGVDCIGPLPKSSGGAEHIILATDYASGYSVGAAIKNKSANTICDFLMKEVILRFGAPLTIQMDSGREFRNKIVKGHELRFNTRMKYSTPYHPEANGKAERTNQTLINKLARIVMHDIRSWDKMLPLALYCYNVSPQKDLKLSPYELVFKTSPLNRLKSMK